MSLWGDCKDALIYLMAIAQANHMNFIACVNVYISGRASAAAMLDPADWQRPRHRITVCFMTAVEEQRQPYETVFFV